MVGPIRKIRIWSGLGESPRIKGLNNRIIEKHTEGHALLQQLPEELKKLAFAHFGKWSQTLAKDHFSTFNEYLLNDEQYQAMTQKFMSTHTESSSSQPSTQSSELQQWSEVMPKASKADITVPQL